MIRVKTTSIVVYISLLVGLIACKNNNPTNTKSEESLPKNDGFISIFDGETLNDWKGNATYWSVENGNLTGIITPETLLSKNTFIIWQGGEPSNFELKLEYRISEDGNSGINYRSETIDSIPYALRGYQADIDGKNNYTGQNYEERKRTTLAYQGEKVNVNPLGNSETKSSLAANIEKNCWQNREVTKSLGSKESLLAHIKKDDWNQVHLIVNGNRMKHYVNGVLMSDVTDNDTTNRTMSGKIGVQVHVGPPMKVEFRDIRLKEIAD